MATKLQSEKKKQIIVAVLLGVLAIVLVYQFFFSEKPKLATGSANRNAAPTRGRATTTVGSPEAAEKTARRQSDRQTDAAEMDAIMADMSRLDLRIVQTSGSAAVNAARGNIFDYWIAPPPKPVPPPPPPPIALNGVSPQNATAGTPRSFTLSVYGRGFPQDAQVIMDGRPRATKRVNETTLAIEMAPQDYPSQRTISVEVKSQSEPAKFYSNPVSFVVTAAPEPPFKFIGLLGEQALLEFPAAKEVIRVSQGSTVQNVWRVDAITLQAVELTHTQFNIKKRVPLVEKGR